MATKLKNIRRSKWTKAIVFLFSVFLVWSIVTITSNFIFTGRQIDFGFYLSNYYATDYFDTETAKNEVQNAVINVVLSAENNSYYYGILDGIDYIYVDTSGNTLVTSDPSKFLVDFRQGNYVVYENGKITDVGGTLPPAMLGNAYIDRTGKAIVSFPDEYWGDNYTDFDNNMNFVREFVDNIKPLSAWLLILIILMVISAGRKPHSDDLHLTFIDRMWTELHISGIFALTLAMFAIFVIAYDSYRYSSIAEFRFVSRIICTAAICIYCGFMWIFLSLVRKVKARSLIKCSCICWCWHKIKAIFKAVMAFTKEFIRNFTGVEFKDTHFAAAFHKIQVRFVVISVLMFIAFCFSVFMVIATWGGVQFIWTLICIAIVILEGIFIWYYMKKTTSYAQSMSRLLIQIDKVSAGNLNYDAEINEGDMFYNSSDKLANIGEGLSEALEEQMKGERMKIELITNVSHDLKTPLTSIISYIDLLKKENMDDVARDYVNILSQKADRLKGIVSDLFDLAKTNSGNAQLDIKPLDFAKLTNQLLGDMEDKIESSGMKLKVNLAPSPVIVRADGKKLSRALQNVLDNALKYSLSGSRIYIDLVKDEEKAVLSVKNTSAFEMDFTADEIMQRFVRGDKNRSTEGSGLGLSIAQSFTEVSGGSFNVSIDGDQFKTLFTFPLCRDEITMNSEAII